MKDTMEIKMNIVDFTAAHVGPATRIALRNYDEERARVPTLPPIERVPDLSPYAENGLGVAAYINDEMIGFLCSEPPFQNAFRSTDAVGVFSPMGANGAIGEKRAEVFARMYQAAGEKWARAGASSHAVCLYAHDKQVQEQFFRYGFGLRCLDAIRALDNVDSPSCDGLTFHEVSGNKDALEVLPLENMLHSSYLKSPFFVSRAKLDETTWMEYWNGCHPLCFSAKRSGRNVAFILAEQDGENFIRDTAGYLHITGMYCQPEYRGKGVSLKLLRLLTEKMKAGGFTRLGVDFESINPSGYGFWIKHFTVYTHSVVRRIDEHAVRR